MEVMAHSDEVDHCHERERLKMRIGVLEECVKSWELECKSSRDTVLRLTTESERERRKAASSAAALDSVKVELDNLVVEKKSIEMKTEILMEQLEASKRLIEAVRQESCCLEIHVKELERKVHTSHGETHAAEKKLQIFLEKVAGLLQERSKSVTLSTEHDILHEVENLCKKRITEMEARLCQVSEQVMEQTELHHSATQRAQLAEQQFHDLRQRLKRVETELLTAGMQRDTFRQSKQHYEEYLHHLSETMKIENIAVDLSSEMMLKLIQTRAEQLVNQEASALVESKNLTYSLQRKLKSQKDQIENKGLHIQLLRTKVSELEEEKKSRSAEHGDAHQEVRKLRKKLERLQGELRATKLSNAELKAQLSHTNELKLKSKDLKGQEKKSRDEQEQLQTLRQSLARLSERERELADFRMIVCRMLSGLDARDSTFSNSEIIKSLETHLYAHRHHHHHPVTCACPAHHMPYLHQILDIPDISFMDSSTSTSSYPWHAGPLHEH